MRLVRTLGIGLVLLLAAGALLLWVAGQGSFGSLDSEQYQPVPAARSPESVDALRSVQSSAAAGVGAEQGQILFGDLHVHTTISFDAFMLNLPLMGGEGAHPPADACDFARHCAALDFWSINDHASNIHPDDWRNTIEAVRQCNAVAGGDDDPDLVSFLGWEWTQAGATPETHYGHKNVVLAHTDDERIPSRPIAASAGGVAALPPSVWVRGALALQGGRFHDLARRWTELGALDLCGEGEVRSLPADCREVAPTPAELFRKLDEWGNDAIVIPHGTAWGIYTPPSSSWDKQLRGDLHDPKRQTLLEVYSGHGDAEVYRDWRAVEFAADGTPRCPEERPDYLPMCRRAGQLILERCLADDEPEAECEERAEQARRNALVAGVSPHTVVPGTSGEDWLDAGQCRDCMQASFKYRPASSAQYITALGNFDDDSENPRRFRMGFMASSDIHTGRAGVGYKELRKMTDAGQEPRELGDSVVGSFIQGPPEEPQARPRTIEEAREVLRGLQLYESERSQSFLYTGGLIAVHSDGRDRASIWDGLRRRQVYGTSGPRILLWFDLVGLAGGLAEGPVPMGGELETRDSPRFEVRAVGSFAQQPGCPDESREALGDERLQRLCAGECYHPGDSRRLIERIEVVRIRPQTRPDEDIASLIDDPFLAYDCPADPGGCVFSFSDPEFASAGRDTVYYVRVLEAPIPTVNGDPLDCERDALGRCLESRPCERGEACLADLAPRAWSSPIWVDYLRR